MARPRVALVVGYFDWFSGYQETALASGLADFCDVEVIAGSKVSPIFSDVHLERIGAERDYSPCLRSQERGVVVTRFATREVRSMVWSRQTRRYLESQKYDLIIQVMPGQGFPIAASLCRTSAVRVVLYGDNSAMWSGMSAVSRRLKWAVFSVTKGIAYRFTNRRADHIFGYTPETTVRLKRFQGQHRLQVLPLAYDPNKFFHDNDLRQKWRTDLGYAESDVVVGSVGKFQPYKELERLVSSVSMSLSCGAVIKLLLVGDDDSEYAKELKGLVQRTPGLEERTQFLKFQSSDALNGILNAIDIGVWPKLPAITIQQAMATGVLVALPQNEWVSHLIRDGSGEYFDDSVSPLEALSASITRLAARRQDVASRSARARLNSWFSSTAIAQELISLARTRDR